MPCIWNEPIQQKRPKMENEQIEKAIIEKGLKYVKVTDENNQTTFKVSIDNDSKFTLDFGYVKKDFSWFHNRNSNNGVENSVWNVSRETKCRHLGWYRFTSKEILNVIKDI